jgi:hypothetical protein
MLFKLDYHLNTWKKIIHSIVILAIISQMLIFSKWSIIVFQFFRSNYSQNILVIYLISSQTKHMIIYLFLSFRCTTWFWKNPKVLTEIFIYLLHTYFKLYCCITMWFVVPAIFSHLVKISGGQEQIC